jgi:hypothetical protein
MTELYTNVTRGTLEPNTVSLVGGPIRPDATVMTAQTFRSGSADVDAVDYANDFLVNPENVLVNDMALRYVIQAHRPCVTATNWRLDCGISAYDNSNGLPPFLPTTLRFEDYGYRLWLQEPRFAAAHVDAVQTHYRNPYMRAGLAHDLWNEGVANYLKGRLMASLEEVRDTQLVFDGNVEVDRRDTEPIMDTGLRYYRLALRRASEEAEAKKGDLLRRLRMARHFAAFASDLYRWFDGFDLDVFHAHLQHTVASEVADIRTTMGMWPTVLDAALDIRSEGRLPRCTRER